MADGGRCSTSSRTSWSSRQKGALPLITGHFSIRPPPPDTRFMAVQEERQQLIIHRDQFRGHAYHQVVLYNGEGCKAIKAATIETHKLALSPPNPVARYRAEIHFPQLLFPLPCRVRSNTKDSLPSGTCSRLRPTPVGRQSMISISNRLPTRFPT
jgi:hypothetical protein